MSIVAESLSSVNEMASLSDSPSFRLTSETLYGMDTQNSTKAAVTSFLADSLANPSVTQENEKERPMNETCGLQHGIAFALLDRIPHTRGGEPNLWRTPSSQIIDPKKSVVKLTGRTPQDPQVGLADQVGGQLNPEWVEWLMNWPLGWTSLDPLRKDNFDDWEQRTQTSSKNVSGGIVRSMWWDNDPSEASHRQESVKQRTEQHSDSLPRLPHERTFENGDMGSGTSKAIDMRDLPNGVSAETESPVYPLRESGMFEREGQAVSRIALGIKNRVDRLKALGNGQVSLVAATAWHLLSEGLNV